MQSFDGHLLEMVRAEIVTVDEGIKVVHDEGSFMRALKGRSSAGDRKQLIR